jgi:Histidine kinase-like ATPase domain
MQVVRMWQVGDAAGIGRVRHQVVECLSRGARDQHGHIGLAGSPGSCGFPRSPAEHTAHDGLVELRNRVALSCSELVTNALRHGKPPIEVCLMTDGDAWLLDVTDAATDRLPNPYPERPLGQGGYGLLLVARLASQLGWYVGDDAKHVWARIEPNPDADLVEELATG